VYKLDQGFKRLFNPKSIAFIGASNNPTKWGYIVLANLISGGFKGFLYPINPHEKKIQGLMVYPKIADLPETPDLAIIVIPSFAIPAVIDECVAKGIRTGLIITAGFAEVGAEGARLQREIVETARKGGMLLVGPNCNGIMRPSSDLYPVMPSLFPQPGAIAVISQSGNMAASITRLLMNKGFGCSYYVSTGNEANSHCDDFFEYLAEDQDTKVILSYIEGLSDGRRFFETAKMVTKMKPIVILKAGDTEAGAVAAKSHTATLSSANLAFHGVCRQAGVILAENIHELINIGAGFVRQPLPQGKRVGIITVGGGWGLLAADACVKVGLEVATLPDKTLLELNGFLPSWWSHGNPVDLVAGMNEDNLRKTLESLLRCTNIDGLIVLGIITALPFERQRPAAHSENAECQREDMIQRICDICGQCMELADHYRKPVIIASQFPFALGNSEKQIGYMLGQNGYVCYPEPNEAVAAMASLSYYAEYIQK